MQKSRTERRKGKKSKTGRRRQHQVMQMIISHTLEKGEWRVHAKIDMSSHAEYVCVWRAVEFHGRKGPGPLWTRNEKLKRVWREEKGKRMKKTRQWERSLRMRTDGLADRECERNDERKWAKNFWPKKTEEDQKFVIEWKLEKWWKSRRMASLVNRKVRRIKTGPCYGRRKTIPIIKDKL